jgi:RNA polymerase sigma-70 factor (ECF subfamily)
MEKTLILLWLEEKNYDEIAEITGLTRSNVAVKLMRIKNKLKEWSNE